jgi:riboflavin biosynthesis pyrimidine reductase
VADWLVDLAVRHGGLAAEPIDSNCDNERIKSRDNSAIESPPLRCCIMTRVESVTEHDLYRAYLDKRLAPQDPSQVSVLFNMVASMDGVTTIKAAADAPASERGLGHRIDQKLMNVLRVHADCVLNGAATLQASGTSPSISPAYPDLAEERLARGKGSAPLAAVLAAEVKFQPDIYGSAFFTDTSFDSVLFTLEGQSQEDLDRVRLAGARKQFSLIELPNGEEDVRDLVRVLHEHYHVQVLLVEGGASVNGSFIRNGLGDHFFLTESPHIAIQSPASRNAVAGSATLLRAQLVPLALESAFYVQEFGGIFQHWRFVR